MTDPKKAKRLIELADLGLLNVLAEASRTIGWDTAKAMFKDDIQLVSEAKKELEAKP